MSKPLLIASGWLLTAAGTFALGWSLRSSGNYVSDGDASAQVPVRSSITGKRTLGEEGKARKRQTAEDAFLAKYIIGGGVSPANMKLAMKAVVDENDPLKRAALFTTLLAQLTPENAKAAFEAFDRTGGVGRFGRFGDNSKQLFMNAWARMDGELAVKALEEQAKANEGQGGGRGGRGGPTGVMDMYSALTGWATVDASKASAYVEGLENDRMKSMYTSGIVRGLMVNGVDEAVDYVSSLPEDSGDRSRYMSTIAGDMLEQGLSSATAWVDGLTDASVKDGAMSRVAEEYAREDLDGAVSWVKEHADEAYAASAVSEVAERWANQDPQAVIEWAAELPDASQAKVYYEALDEWTKNDPAAASEYLAEMPDSAAKDSAVEGFATELSREDPESAMAWADTISDPQVRSQAITEVAQDWYRQDRAAVEAWLPSSGLSQEAQETVLQPQRGRGFGRGGRGR